MVNADSNDQMVIQQHVMLKEMVFWEIYVPLEHISVHDRKNELLEELLLGIGRDAHTNIGKENLKEGIYWETAYRKGMETLLDIKSQGDPVSAIFLAFGGLAIANKHALAA